MASTFVRKNMGQIDRLIRTVTGLAMMYFGFVDQSIIDDLTINLIVGVFGIVSIAFAYIAFCPIYTFGNISTAKKSSSDG